MALTGVLVGGRFDGGRLKPASRNTFAWVGIHRDGSEDEPSVFAKPGKDRELYRVTGTTTMLLDGIETDVELLLHAGHTYSLCACGSFIERSQLENHAACT